MTVAPLLYTPEEAADVLRLSRTEIYRLIRVGELESVRIGARRRLPAQALNEYVDRLRDMQARPSTRIRRNAS